MSRREFLTLLGGAAAWPLAARAQAPTAVQKVGYLSDESRSLGAASFEIVAKALRELGYVEGRSIAFESRFAEDKNDLLPALAVELVRMRVNVIIAVGTPATRAAKNATNSIPIVFSRIADPLALGLVTSLARPGGNLTGVSVIAPDLAAKRLEMLVEVIPGIRCVAGPIKSGAAICVLATCALMSTRPIPAANSSRTPPSRPRGSARGRASACDIRDNDGVTAESRPANEAICKFRI
jgi:putative tryptophan/tyrosine transport system substrate-binding protein